MQCPRCESEISGELRRKVIKQTKHAKLLEVTVGCRVCLWEKHVRYTSHEYERSLKLYRNIKAMFNSQNARYGQADVNTIKGLNEARIARDKELDTVRQMMHES